MGFNGGGGTGTLANHTHDPSVTNDGGALASNKTSFGLSGGSVLYSDGTNIEELTKGSALQVLKMNSGATAPEWGTVGGALSDAGSTTLGSAGDALDIAITNYEVIQIQAVLYNSGQIRGSCRINDDSGSNYEFTSRTLSSTNTNNAASRIDLTDAVSQDIVLTITCLRKDGKGWECNYNGGYQSSAVYGYFHYNQNADMTDFDFDNAGTGDYDTGSFAVANGRNV